MSKSTRFHFLPKVLGQAGKGTGVKTPGLVLPLLSQPPISLVVLWGQHFYISLGPFRIKEAS